MFNTISRTLSMLAVSGAVILLMTTSPFAQETASGSQASPPTPKAIMPITSYSFDDVYRGEIISQIFVIKNAGNADLVITDLTAGCACEVVQFDRVIAPGKEGMAVIEINTNNVVGGAVRTATLHTNDPERPSILLTLIANVLSNTDGSPLSGVTLREGKHIGPLFVGPGLRWGAQVQPGAKVSKEFVISVDRGSVKILRTESAQSYFVPRITTVEEGKKYTLSVESAPMDEPGKYDANLRVFTDSKFLPYFDISLFLKVLPKK